MNIVEHVSLLQIITSYNEHLMNICLGMEWLDLPVVLCPIFLRICQIDFQSGCTSLQSHQQWRSVSPKRIRDLGAERLSGLKGRDLR